MNLLAYFDMQFYVGYNKKDNHTCVYGVGHFDAQFYVLLQSMWMMKEYGGR